MARGSKPILNCKCIFIRLGIDIKIIKAFDSVQVFPLGVHVFIPNGVQDQLAVRVINTIKEIYGQNFNVLRLRIDIADQDFGPLPPMESIQHQTHFDQVVAHGDYTSKFLACYDLENGQFARVEINFVLSQWF